MELFAGTTLLVMDGAMANTASPRLAWSNQDRAYSLKLSPRSLLGALWLQAALSIAEHKEFRRCVTCGRPIEISRSGGARTDAMFCSGAGKMRDYRARRAQARTFHAKKWSLSEIANQLRTDVGTVAGWLK